ncbi:hypothetical protein DM02DRAFT_290372 [Periconia macrospinosa]|uniref:Spindle pole body-associated protein cut12 domain-containing protein n=1 Tax=Periconia macrospinosa TaxID=97972 RepID=A0A2V1DXH2_9PLEO|nr:hypothetical protein DM02DRAFT_290372 [Periconia macrospinosa]
MYTRPPTAFALLNTLHALYNLPSFSLSLSRNMFSWFTGSRVTNAIEELEADVGYENTIIDPPETPAHHFAVKALKHAVFGTPAPEDTAAAKKLQKKQLPDVSKTKALELHAPKDRSAPPSPSKHPAGIMKTPITASKSRKSVSFGAHVVDNEGKRGHVSKSGIPDDCPGKFPSPWTPGTELKTGLDSDQKPRTKLTAALFDARTTKQPKPGQKQKARDDSDITVDLGAPRSDSGKYWKEQYESYAKQSEKEVKKLVTKQQMAKSFAKQKDDEVVELVKQLEEERKRHRRRELQLEQQNKEQQESLRRSMAEQHSAGVEITVLKKRIAALEKSSNIASSENQGEKMEIPVYEDTSKEVMASQPELDHNPEISYLSAKSHTRLAGKENAPPKPRHVRRQTLPDSRSATPFNVKARLGVGDGHVSTVIGKPPRPRRASQSATKSIHESSIVEQNYQIPSNFQAAEPIKDGVNPGAPLVFQSSPLPQPSPGPDLWLMNNDESDYGTHDRMAIPISSGRSYGKPSGSGRHPIQRPLPKAKTERSKPTIQPGSMDRASAQPEAPRVDSNNYMPPASSHPGKTRRPTNSRDDVAKPISHHVEAPSQETKEKVESSQARKDLARQRLAERKKKKSALS